MHAHQCMYTHDLICIGAMFVEVQEVRHSLCCTALPFQTISNHIGEDTHLFSSAVQSIESKKENKGHQDLIRR